MGMPTSKLSADDEPVASISTRAVFATLFLSAIALRMATALHPYSGKFYIQAYGP